jgi:energy-coupling factor transporter ATP-binding protein EcfA2
MTDSLSAPIPDLFIALAGIGGTFLVLGAAIALSPRLVGCLRQRSYDRTASAELVRLELMPTRAGEIDPTAATAMIRGLHPRQRRGFDRWRVGWPSTELRVVWRDGDLRWQVEGHRQVLDEFAVSHRALHLVTNARSVDRVEPPAAATAIGRLARPDSWPLRVADLPGDRVLHRLVGALEAATPAGVEVRFRVHVRPVPPDAWREVVDPEPSGSRPIISLVGDAIFDGILFRESGSGRALATPPSALERDARARKRRGAAGFETALLIEVAGTTFDRARALLWHLTDATDSLADAGQEVRWEVVPGPVKPTLASRLADWEVAQLWYLPDETFDAAELPRPRPLPGALPSPQHTSAAVVIGANGDRPLAVPLATLDRHLAVVGSTGSGKSTLLLQLVTGLLDTSWGATVVDPHGDLVADILARVPARHADRVHVLRLADRDHPRGFNFFERRSAEEAQMVVSEFVALFEDLWPRFTGPRMRDILRYAALTMLSDPQPQTVLELDRILADQVFRRPYVDQAIDPAIQNYWRTRWPSKGSDDPSVGAVQNKLGAFIAYDSIRAVVGQGTSTLRPRAIMDRGDLLLVDLSQVGGDNASIMGGMLIARYRIDALGRQGTNPASRRPHLLVVDETPRFSTRALGGLMNEGRKFAVAVGLATQTLKDIGEALGATAVANAGTIALMAPGLDDAKALAPLFAPLTAADLLGMERHGMAVKMAGPKGHDVVYGGIVLPPRPADQSIAAAILASSDARDARPRAEVAAEVTERLTRIPPKPEPAKPAQAAPKVNATSRAQQLPGGE